MEGGLTPLWRTGRRRPPVSWRPGSNVEEGFRRRRLQHRRQTEHLRTSSDTSQTNKPPQEETEQQQLGGSGSLPVGMERAGARLRPNTKRQERSISGGGKEDEGQSSHQGTVNR